MSPVGARVAALSLLLAGSPILQAHRIDETLQATFIAVASNSIRVELNLTPGTEVVSALVAELDTDRDRQISGVEASTYGDRIRSALTLSVDGTPVALDLVRHELAPLEVLQSGSGLLRFEYSAASAIPPGSHRLRFFNHHQTNRSVYLVNALLPESPAIQILGQHRDLQQQEMLLDFRILPSGASRRSESRRDGWIHPVARWATLAMGLGLVALGIERIRARRPPSERRSPSRPGDVR